MVIFFASLAAADLEGYWHFMCKETDLRLARMQLRQESVWFRPNSSAKDQRIVPWSNEKKRGDLGIEAANQKNAKTNNKQKPNKDQRHTTKQQRTKPPNKTTTKTHQTTPKQLPVPVAKHGRNVLTSSLSHRLHHHMPPSIIHTTTTTATTTVTTTTTTTTTTKDNRTKR